MNLGWGDSELSRICEVAAHVSKANAALLVECYPKGNGTLRGAFGSSPFGLTGRATIPGLDSDVQPNILLHKLKNVKWFSDHPLGRALPNAQALAATTLPLRGTAGNTFYLVLLFNKELERVDQVDFALLTKLAHLSQALIQLTETRQEYVSKSAASEKPVSMEDNVKGEAAVMAFLMKSLPRNPRILSKGNLSFFAVRKWRSQLKDSQLSAYAGISSALSDAAAQVIAKDLALAIQFLFQGLAFDGIVPARQVKVQQSSNFTLIIARHLGNLIGSPVLDIFAKEKEHNAKGSKRNKQSGNSSLSGHFLVLDDISSSGKNLGDSVAALRTAGASASAITWIGP